MYKLFKVSKAIWGGIFENDKLKYLFILEPSYSNPFETSFKHAQPIYKFNRVRGMVQC